VVSIALNMFTYKFLRKSCSLGTDHDWSCPGTAEGWERGVL